MISKATHKISGKNETENKTQTLVSLIASRMVLINHFSLNLSVVHNLFSDKLFLAHILISH